LDVDALAADGKHEEAVVFLEKSLADSKTGDAGSLTSNMVYEIFGYYLEFLADPPNSEEAQSYYMLANEIEGNFLLLAPVLSRLCSSAEANKIREAEASTPDAVAVANKKLELLNQV
jgi:hypothetical protein